MSPPLPIAKQEAMAELASGVWWMEACGSSVMGSVHPLVEEQTGCGRGGEGGGGGGSKMEMVGSSRRHRPTDPSLWRGSGDVGLLRAPPQRPWSRARLGGPLARVDAHQEWETFSGRTAAIEAPAEGTRLQH